MESGDREASPYQFEEGATSYYEALGVTETADYAEIRGRYRVAILALHPDKSAARGEEVRHHEEFVKIQRAWDVLGNKELRAAYDSFRLQRRAALDREQFCQVTADVVVLEDMEEVQGQGYAYPCRCGDSFSVSIQELKEGCSGKELPDKKVSSSEDKSGAANEFSGGVGHTYSLLLPCPSCSLYLRLDICS